MNGWEFLATAGWMLVTVWAIVLIWFIGILIHHAYTERLRARYQTSKAWEEGYVQGVSDERKAAEWDVPEYRIPRRQNPYGEPAKPKGDSDADEPLQAARRTQLPE